MDSHDFTRPIFVPVILGTSRQGRASEHAAGFVVDHVSKRTDIRTELVDIRNIRLSIDDAGEALKDPKFSATVNETDAFDLCCARIQSQFSRPSEARARHEFEGIHSQSRRCLRRLGWPIRWRTHDPEFSAGAARTRHGNDLLGCLFR